MIAAIIYYFFLGTLIILIGSRLLDDVFKSSKKKKRFKNPFDEESQDDRISSTEILEKEAGPSLTIISLTVSFATWSILYFAQNQVIELFEMLKNYQGLTSLAFIIFFGLAGNQFMRKLMNNIGSSNEFHDTRNVELMYQRAKGAVNMYMAFILGGLVFTFLTDISFDFKILLFAPLSFIVGSGFYLLLRQNPDHKKIRSLFLAAMEKQKIKSQSDNHSEEEIDLEL